MIFRTLFGKKNKLFGGRAELYSVTARTAKMIGEYGVGESTVWAYMNTRARIVSVDTSREWIEKVNTRINDDGKRVTLEWIDLGVLGKWGRPSGYDKMNKFVDYFTSIWSHDQKPDVVLVDGRFRISCFLHSLLCSSPGTKIVFDDYVNRPCYHVVERFIKPIRCEGTQALFISPEFCDRAEVKNYIEKFSMVMD